MNENATKFEELKKDIEHLFGKPLDAIIRAAAEGNSGGGAINTTSVILRMILLTAQQKNILIDESFVFLSRNNQEKISVMLADWFELLGTKRNVNIL